MTFHSLPNTWNFRSRIVSGIFRAFILSLLMAAFGPIQLQGKTVAYVANMDGNSISVIDVASNTVTATIAVGGGPTGIVFSPDGSKAYVTNHRSASISVINTATNSVTTTISLGGGGGQPAWLAITPDGNNLYVPSYTGNVLVVNTASNSVTATIPIPAQVQYPAAVAMAPDGQKAYVRCHGFVVVIDTATNKVVKLISAHSKQGWPGIGILPSGSKLYVAGGTQVAVDVIATASGSVTTTSPSSAVGIAVAPDGDTVYAAVLSNNSVSAIGAGGNAASWVLNGVPSPEGLAVTPDGAFVYVANTIANTVSVVSTSTRAVVATIPVGRNPLYVAIAKVS